MTNSIQPLIAEAERFIAEACQHFHLNILPSELTVTIQSKGRVNAAGWFAWDRWGNESKVLTTVDQLGSDVQVKREMLAPCHEINLSAECLATEDIAMVLLHELCHAENHKLGIKDCDKTNKKHNKEFKARAELLGLNVLPKDPRVGWGTTELGSEGKKFVEKIAFKRELFALFRLPAEKREGAGSRMLKLTCADEECGYVIRTTKKHIEKGLPTCVCGQGFVREEEEVE